MEKKSAPERNVFVPGEMEEIEKQDVSDKKCTERNIL